MNDKPPDNGEGTRQERRQEKLQKKRERTPQHGRNLARLYKEAILQRIKRLRSEKRQGQGK